MSVAAEEYVRTCAQLNIRRSARDFLWAIAQLVPEGETTTIPVGLEDLASRAQQAERTARRNRDLLESLDEIKEHDGGQGKVARYEMLKLLDGARPMTTAPLPLLGRPKERRAKQRRSPTSDLLTDVAHDAAIKQRSTSDLLTDVQIVRAYNIGQKIRCWLLYIGHFCRSWLHRTKKQRSTSDLLTDVVTPAAIKQRSTSDLLTDVGGPLSSSSYVRTEVVVDARAREPADAFLDWFEAEYPTVHAGAACTIDRARDPPLVRALLERPQTNLAHLQALTRLLWTITTDGVVKSDRWWIAERVTVRNVFVLHRKIDFLDREFRRTTAPAPYDAVWQQILERLETKMSRHEFYTWFRPLVLVADRPTAHGPVIEVTSPGGDARLVADWIQKHYAAIVQAAVDDVRPGARVTVIETKAMARKSG